MTEYKVIDDGVEINVSIDYVGVPGKCIEEMMGTDSFNKMCVRRCAQIVDEVMGEHRYDSAAQKLTAILEIFD